MSYSPTNAESMIFYQHLITDAEDGINDATVIEDIESRARTIKSFEDLIAKHKENIARLNKQATDDGEDVLEEIKIFIEKYEGWLIAFGGLLGEGFKKTLVKLINAAKKILETITKEKNETP